MSNFTTPLDTRYLDGNDYLLLEDFEFYFFRNIINGNLKASLKGICDSEKSLYVKITLKVPKGFITDFASIPLPLQLLISKTGKHGKAAVVHDYLYRCALQNVFLFDYGLGMNPSTYIVEDDGSSKPSLCYKESFENISQHEIDLIFKLAMEVLGVSSWRKFAIYKGVDLFGHFTFDKYVLRNKNLQMFSPGDFLKTNDLRIYEKIPLRVEVESVRRNLVKLKGVPGEYLTYNFKKLTG